MKTEADREPLHTQKHRKVHSLSPPPPQKKYIFNNLYKIWYNAVECCCSCTCEQNLKKQFVTVWKKGAVKKSRFVLSCED